MIGTCWQVEVLWHVVMIGTCWQVEHMLETEDYGKDLATVQNLNKKHQVLDADVKAHEERVKRPECTGW